MANNRFNRRGQLNNKKVFVIVFLLFLIILFSGSFYTIFTQKSGAGVIKEDIQDIDVDQILIKVLIKSKEFLNRTIRVMNIGTDISDIEIEVKGVEDIVNVEEKSFTLKPGQTKRISTRFSAFNEEKKIEHIPDIYIGKLDVKSKDTVKTIPLIIEVESKNILFDMNLNPLARERTIYPGEKVTIEVKLFNLEEIKPVNIDMEYFVKDLEGNTIISESETVVVQNQASFYKTISIPENFRSENYVFIALAKYGSSTGTASYLFEVSGIKEAAEAEKRTYFDISQLCNRDPFCWVSFYTIILLFLALGASVYFFIGGWIYNKINSIFVNRYKKKLLVKKEEELENKEKQQNEILELKQFEIEQKIKEEERKKRRFREFLHEVGLYKTKKEKKDIKREKRLERERRRKENERIRVREDKSRFEEEKRRLNQQRKKEKIIKEIEKEKEKESRSEELRRKRIAAQREITKRLHELLHKVGLYKTKEEKRERKKLRKEEEAKKRIYELKNKEELEKKRLEEKKKQERKRENEESKKRNELKLRKKFNKNFIRFNALADKTNAFIEEKRLGKVISFYSKLKSIYDKLITLPIKSEKKKDAYSRLNEIYLWICTEKQVKLKKKESRRRKRLENINKSEEERRKRKEEERKLSELKNTEEERKRDEEQKRKENELRKKKEEERIKLEELSKREQEKKRLELLRKIELEEKRKECERKKKAEEQIKLKEEQRKRKEAKRKQRKREFYNRLHSLGLYKTEKEKRERSRRLKEKEKETERKRIEKLEKKRRLEEQRERKAKERIRLIELRRKEQERKRLEEPKKKEEARKRKEQLRKAEEEKAKKERLRKQLMIKNELKSKVESFSKLFSDIQAFAEKNDVENVIFSYKTLKQLYTELLHSKLDKKEKTILYTKLKEAYAWLVKQRQKEIAKELKVKKRKEEKKDRIRKQGEPKAVFQESHEQVMAGEEEKLRKQEAELEEKEKEQLKKFEELMKK